MAVTPHIKIRTTSIAKLGKFKAEGTNADLVFDLITLTGKMIRPAAPLCRAKVLQDKQLRSSRKNVLVPVISRSFGTNRFTSHPAWAD